MIIHLFQVFAQIQHHLLQYQVADPLNQVVLLENFNKQ